MSPRVSSQLSNLLKVYQCHFGWASEMDNLGTMEINEIRFLTLGSDQLRHLNATKIDPDVEGAMTANEEIGSYAGSAWDD